jgi:hypothetical protein
VSFWYGVGSSVVKEQGLAGGAVASKPLTAGGKSVNACRPGSEGKGGVNLRRSSRYR